MKGWIRVPVLVTVEDIDYKEQLNIPMSDDDVEYQDQNVQICNINSIGKDNFNNDKTILYMCNEAYEVNLSEDKVLRLIEQNILIK